MMSSLYYIFELNLQRIYIDIDLPCQLQIRWKRNKNKVTTKTLKVKDHIQFLDINETITIKAKCKLIEGKFAKLATSLTVLLYPFNENNQIVKQGGKIQEFDLTQIILPDNLKASVSKNFEHALQKSTKNARLVFTLSSQFSEQQEQSQGDISFQSNNLKGFQKSQIDMTFRPAHNSEEKHRKISAITQIHSKQNDQQKFIESPFMRTENISQYRLQGRLQEKTPLRIENLTNHHHNNSSNRPPEYRAQQRQAVRPQQPLGFSFGPNVLNVERQRQRKEMLDHINEYRQSVNEKQQEVKRLEGLLRGRQAQRGDRGMDEKKVQLINELKAAMNQCEALRKQRSDIINQLNKAKEQGRDVSLSYNNVREELRDKQLAVSKLKEDNKEITNHYNNLRHEAASQLGQLSVRYEARRKQLEEIKSKYDKCTKDNEELKNEVFRQQSELISRENELQALKMQHLNKSMPIMQELKRVNQDLGRQRAQLQKLLNETSIQLERQRQIREELQRKGTRQLQIREELQRKGGMKRQEAEMQKNQLIEYIQLKEAEYKSNIVEIEEEMSKFIAQKKQLLEQKEAKLLQMSRKYNEAALINEDGWKASVMKEKQWESLNIQISELKVKIKHLEQIYLNLQKDYAQKQKEVQQKGEFVQKIREYVSKLEQDVQLKDTLIQERDHFISKAKEYICKREGELNEQIQRLKKESAFYKQKYTLEEKAKGEMVHMNSSSREKEKFINDIVKENNEKQDKMEQMQQELQYLRSEVSNLNYKIEEMEGYIDMQHGRFEVNQEQFEEINRRVDELNRKIRSQEQTMEELVKKNLQMQLEINLKTFQLRNKTR